VKIIFIPLIFLLLCAANIGFADEPKLEPTIIEPEYKSEQPLYFKIVLGEKKQTTIFGVLDESEGPGLGYNRFYLDLNRDLDLTNDEPQNFAKRKTADEFWGKYDKHIKFNFPTKSKVKAEYKIDIYSLNSKSRKGPAHGQYHFFWYLDIGEWHYFFINGQLNLYPSFEDALKGVPILMTRKYEWNISVENKKPNCLLRVGLTDKNGCTLRSLSAKGVRLSPTVTFIDEEKQVKREPLVFG